MNEAGEAEQPAVSFRGGWGDLALYVLGGAGAFAAASLALATQVKELDFRVTAGAILLNVMFIGGAPYVFGIRRGRLTWEELGLRPLRWKAGYIPGILLTTFLLLPLRALLAFAVQMMVEGGFESIEARSALIFPEGIGLGGFLTVLVGVGVLAPMAEEFYFRGLIQGWLRQRLRPAPAVLITATLFGLAHFDAPGVAASAFLLGIAMGWAYEYTRSLAVPMGMHVLTNSLAILLGAAGMVWQEVVGLLWAG